MAYKKSTKQRSRFARRKPLAFKSITSCIPVFASGEIASRDRAMGFYLAPGMPLPNPDPVLKKMGKDISAYNDILSDPFVSGCMSSRAAGVLSLNWAVDNGKAPSRAAAFCKDMLDSLRMHRLMAEILAAPGFGYKVLEVIWQLGTDNLLRAVSVQGKPHSWFAFDGAARLLFRSRENPMGEQLPPRKFLLASHKASWENPYGEAVFGNIFWPSVFKKGGLKFWTIFLEKYGTPHAVGKVPRGTGDDEVNNLLYQLESMVRDAIAVIPDDSSVEIKDYAASGGSTDAYERYCSYCKSEISIGVLGQTLTTEVGDKGSFAASKTHMQVRGDIVTGDKKIVEETIQQLLNWVCELNFPGEPVPVFTLYAPEDVDMEQAQRDKVLTECGVRFTPAYFQREYALKPEDFSLVDPAVPANAAPEVRVAGKAAASPVAPKAADSVIETAVAAQSPAELQAQADGLLKPVLDLIRSGKDQEAILSDLAAVYPAMDDAALVEMLTRAIFVMDALAVLQKKN